MRQDEREYVVKQLREIKETADQLEMYIRGTKSD